MDQRAIENLLADLPIGAVRFLEEVGSTNDEAARWALQGAPNVSILAANAQTRGRGRSGRNWVTIPGASLAFSVILYPSLKDNASLPHLTALGALAVCEALKNNYHLPAQIKWPNDVIIHRQKTAGVLAEAQWTGDVLSSVIVGIGINVASASANEAALPPTQLLFPATSIETASGKPVDRAELLRAVLAEFIRWRPRLGWPDFYRMWENNLAFRGEWVQVFAGPSAEAPLQEGQICGLAPDGSLKLTARSGDVITIQFGEVRLRPAAPV